MAQSPDSHFWRFGDAVSVRVSVQVAEEGRLSSSGVG
jgi:hypothetical protein